MPPFRLTAEYVPRGDQPRAIEDLSAALAAGADQQVLLGVTGSGKTFTMANVIARWGRPTLVIAHNKTLAAQLYGEFKQLFPDNAVHYFVSYYDYYQPEAYIPQTDTFIEKDASINDQIDKMRHGATTALFERDDVVVVASVSCIYGLGSPEAYHGLLVFLEEGSRTDRDALLRKLVDIQYQRNDLDFHRGTFRVRGDVVEVFPAHEQDRAIRVEFLGDTITSLQEIDPLRGRTLQRRQKVALYPTTHYVTPPDRMGGALTSIREELRLRLPELKARGKLVEAQRLESRTMYDLELLEQTGYCPGIENYSRHLTGRAPGEPPPCLLDYFPRDFLVFIDESHQTLPQIQGMYRGDRARKETLVEYGFRLPSALDNRPLRYEEFERMVRRVVYVSATPAEEELGKARGRVVEQIIRPTGLMDPPIEVRPARHQVDDLLGEIRKTVERGERVLVTTLTKRMAEELTEYYADLGVKVKYLHSDVETLERVEIVRDLRRGVFDVLVGVNLLREGLDLPEVSLVAILDADKEGFLRSTRSLIQTAGRAARNVEGRVLMYAEARTESMERALAETARRRGIQEAYNRAHGITPSSIRKSIFDLSATLEDADYLTVPRAAEERPAWGSPEERDEALGKLREEMLQAARELDFERAAEIRDRIQAAGVLDLVGLGGPPPAGTGRGGGKRGRGRPPRRRPA